MSDLQAWLTKHADCDYGWFVHDGGFLRCHAHDDDLAAAVVTVETLRLGLGMHEPVTNDHGYLGKCGCGDWRVGLGEPSYNEHVAAAIIEALKP